MNKNLIKIASIVLFTTLQAQNQTSVVEMMQKDGITNVVGWSNYDEDSDKDGVLDVKDKCPNTPEGAQVDENGCVIDSDKDGITDDLDKCPNTPEGVKVDKNGCEIIVSYQFNFALNSYKIDKKYYPEIEKLAKLLKENPDIKIEIQGYTDNLGEARYNLELSKKRAEALKNILVNKYKIDTNRIKTIGFGMKYPIADNTTPEGRAKNRRVIVLNITNKSTPTTPPLDEEKEDLPVNYVK